MPRAKRAAPPEEDADFQLPGLDDLDQDTPPAETRTRTPRRSSTRRTSSRTPATRTSSRAPAKSTQINTVRAEVQTYLTLANAAWSIRDPECAEVADAAIPAVADRVASMIGRNDALLSVLTKSTILGDVIGLLTALTPVARAVWQAHGPGGHQHGRGDDQGQERDDVERYPAFSGSPR